jgi:hypothetical protein
MSPILTGGHASCRNIVERGMDRHRASPQPAIRGRQTDHDDQPAAGCGRKAQHEHFRVGAAELMLPPNSALLSDAFRSLSCACGAAKREG